MHVVLLMEWVNLNYLKRIWIKKILKQILTKHLKSAARLLFGDNHWWLYMDNDPN
jgi:hypothetical protein